MAGYTAWANERLYNSTFTRDTGKAAVVWWSKSDNAWRITDLAFLSIPAGSYLYDTTPLYLAVDPVSGAFFFVVPENNVYQLYRLIGPRQLAAFHTSPTATGAECTRSPRTISTITEYSSR